MAERFNLTARAEAIFPGHHSDGTIYSLSTPVARDRALKLAHELAEAIAARMDRYDGYVKAAHCAEIARSFTRPQSREEVYRAALERMPCWCVHAVDEDHKGDCPKEIARAALEAGEGLRAGPLGASESSSIRVAGAKLEEA